MSNNACFPLSQWNQLFRECIVLAALLHDLGKVTAGFQHKLHRSSSNVEKPDPIRHEVISWALLAPLIRHPLTDGEEVESHWLHQLSDEKQIEHYFDEQATQLKVHLDPEKMKIAHTNGCLFAPLLYGIGWLILSHHRLPKAGNGKKCFVLQDREGEHYNPHLWLDDCDLDSEVIQPFLTIDLNSQALPWKQTVWREAIARCVQKIASLMFQPSENKPNSDTIAARPIPLLAGFHIYQNTREQDNGSMAQFWFSVLYHHLRPILVTADYLGSADKRPYQQADDVNGCCTLPPEKQLFANKVNVDDKSFFADSVAEHLINVAKWSQQLFDQFAHWQTTIPSWRTLENHQLPKRLNCERIEQHLQEGKNHTLHGEERYHWQQDAKYALVAERLRIKKQYPDAHLACFGVIVAETGSGKTMGAIKAITAALGYARVTTALGFRSLTRQTANSYRAKDGVGFKEHEVAALIGVSLEKQLEIQRHTQPMEDVNHYDGSENQINELMAFHWEQSKPLNDDEPHPICSVGAGSLQRMLETPVIVATTDHLAHALEGSRGAQLLPIYRIATSDTLFDELDSYGDEDLITLGRWAYTCGYYGRSLWLVSATLPEHAVTLFAEQYYAGLQAFSLRENQLVQIINALLANRTKPTLKTLAPSELPQFHDYYRHQFLAPLTASIVAASASFPRHRIMTLPEEQDTLLAIQQQVLHFHQQYATEVVIHGCKKRISIGAVMFDRIAETQNSTRWFAENLPKYARVVCYHSRFTLLDRLLIEKTLEPLLNRQDDYQWQQALLENDDIASHLEQHDELLLLVCTTNILETGRDFDFDWACADLLSVRSLVQLAGRVKRHRHVSTECANISLFHNAGEYAKTLMTSANEYKPEKQALLALNNSQRLGHVFADGILHSAPLLMPTKYTEYSPYLDYSSAKQQQAFNHLDGLLNHSSMWLNGYFSTVFRFRQRRQNSDLVAYDYDKQAIWLNGDYQHCKWYVFNGLPYHLNAKVCRTTALFLIKSDQLTKGLITAQWRQKLWERLALSEMSPMLLHHLSLNKVKAAKSIYYSSDLGAYFDH